MVCAGKLSTCSPQTRLWHQAGVPLPRRQRVPHTLLSPDQKGEARTIRKTSTLKPKSISSVPFWRYALLHAMGVVILSFY